MLKLAGRLIVVTILCSAFGLQWLALQSVAWTAMVVQNAKQVSFCQAVKRTFDGAHPCDLCKRVGKARNAEKKQDNQRTTPKADLICVIRQLALLAPYHHVVYFELKSFPVDGSQQPPVPPPRTELA